MTETILITSVLLVTVLGLIYKYLTWQNDTWKKLGLPGPKPKFIYGNFPNLLKQKRHFVYDHEEVYHEYKTKYRAIGVFELLKPEILLLDPMLAHDVMVTNFSKFRDNTASQWIVDRKKDKIAERNPFFQTGDAWKEKRAETLGGVTLSKLNLAYPIWQSTLNKMTKYIKDNIEKGNAIIETKDLSYRFTSNVMSDFVWGIDAGSFTDSDSSKTMRRMLRDLLTQFLSGVGLYFLLSYAPFLKRFFNIRIFADKTDNFFSQITKDAIHMRLKDKSTERADFLNYLIQLQDKKHISHDDIVGHIMTAMLDGFETTATVLHHCLFYLAKHPEVQEKLRAEILNNLGDDGSITFETLHNLTYLEQCVQETMRLITPIPVYSRICTTETKIEFTQDKAITVKPGTIVTIPIFSYHHDEEFFPKPYTYNPERFDKAAHVELTKKGIFMAFGDGPRICIGMRLALFGLKASIVQILKEYRIKSCARTIEEKKPDAVDFVMGLSGDMWLEYEAL
ncbi:probable cytochrome P450 309a2 isoform X1 [Teleopsis dalmanni]|uniref:probable cytochrome P450 309a2 isoform X1 n=1 Tax=Teleopsis dalmanni TaxID=139649 RepID=UPI0018CFCDF0|nr:probable cytochrome P450 309a2 isoform X1 [Teleopsis dalmanni]